VTPVADDVGTRVTVLETQHEGQVEDIKEVKDDIRELRKLIYATLLSSLGALGTGVVSLAKDGGGGVGVSEESVTAGVLWVLRLVAGG